MTEDLVRLADEYIAKNAERLAQQRIVNTLEEEEKKLKALLMETMEKSKASAIGGKLGVVNLKVKDEPTVKDWDKLYKFIVEHDAFDLLQRRLSPPAVRVRWEDEIVIPGVVTFPVSKLTISNKAK